MRLVRPLKKILDHYLSMKETCGVESLSMTGSALRLIEGFDGERALRPVLSCHFKASIKTSYHSQAD